MKFLIFPLKMSVFRITKKLVIVSWEITFCKNLEKDNMVLAQFKSLLQMFGKIQYFVWVFHNEKYPTLTVAFASFIFFRPSDSTFFFEIATLPTRSCTLESRAGLQGRKKDRNELNSWILVRN